MKIAVLIIGIILASCHPNKCEVNIPTGNQLMFIPNTDGTITQVWYPTYKTIDTCQGGLAR